MIKQLSIAAGLMLALDAGAVSVQNGSGTAGTTVDVIVMTTLTASPTSSRSSGGSLGYLLSYVIEYGALPPSLESVDDGSRLR